MTERDRFMTQLEEAHRNGLVDMKFFVTQGHTMSSEDFFCALNRIDDAVKAGKCKRFETWSQDHPVEKVEELVY